MRPPVSKQSASSRAAAVPGHPVAELVHVRKVFHSGESGVVKVLENISLAVWEGEFVAVLGQSGSGKSTLVRCLTGLIPPSAGRVRAEGKNLSGIHPDLALVFQTFALYPWLTVEQNVAVGVLSRRLPADQRREAIEHAMEQTGLTHHHAAYPREISGGMRQRVGIARALVSDPRVLCLDEAFSSLDVLTAENLRQEILALWHRKESRLRSILMVTHNIQEAVEMATRVCVLFPNPGRIGLEVAVPLAYPRNPRSKEFQRIVATIHDAITTCSLPDEPAVFPADAAEGTLPGGGPVTRGPAESLPGVPVGQILGLLSILRDEPSLSNVYQIADEVGREFGETLSLVKAAEILDLVDTPKQNVVLTAVGKKFLEADARGRRELFRVQIQKLRLFSLAEKVLRERGRVKASVLIGEIADLLPHERAEKIFQTLVAWGRYGGLLEFDSDTREVRLVYGARSPPLGPV